jgi:hypothetical protein
MPCSFSLSYNTKVHSCIFCWMRILHPILKYSNSNNYGLIYLEIGFSGTNVLDLLRKINTLDCHLDVLDG